MLAFRVVEHLDVVEHILPGLMAADRQQWSIAYVKRQSPTRSEGAAQFNAEIISAIQHVACRLRTMPTSCLIVATKQPTESHVPTCLHIHCSVRYTHRRFGGTNELPECQQRRKHVQLLLDCR